MADREYTLDEVIQRTVLGVTPNSHEAQAMAAEIVRLRNQVATLLEIVGVSESKDVEDMPENTVND